MMRLDKYLSDATAYSRREIRNLVKRKAITVNGSTAQNADMKINEALDAVCVNGEKVFYRKRPHLRWNFVLKKGVDLVWLFKIRSHFS